MKMRKIISVFLSLICIFTALSIVTLGANAAEGTRTVYATTSASVTQGSYGYLYVYLDDLTELSALNVSVYYDAERVTVKNVYNQVSSIINDLNTGDGCVNASYIFDGKGTAAKTNLFYVYYQVNSGAEAGEACFDIVVNEAYDSSFKDMDFSGSHCSFKITEKTVTKSCSISSSSTVSTSVGGEFELSYRLSNYQIASGAMSIQYDPELFEVVSATGGGFLEGKIADINTALDGTVSISFVGTEYKSKYDVIKVCFKTLKNVGETSEIKLVVSELYDKELNLYSCSGYTTKATVVFDESYTEDAPSMSVSATYNAETGKVTATVKLEKESYLGAGDFVLSFDAKYLSYLSAEKGFAPTFFNINDKQAAEGIIKFSIISMTDITAEETVLTVTFDCPVSCEGFTTSFSITGSGLTDSMVNIVVLNFVDSSLDIVGVGHNMTDATCTEASVCKNEGCAYTVGSALGHIMTEATCTEAAKCLREGCDYVEGTALGHRVMVDGRVWVDSITFENDANYPFELNEGVYASSNKVDSTESSFAITALYDCTLTISYSVSSEGNYDKLIIKKNGTQLYQISGVVDWSTAEIALRTGDVITVSYKKDGSVSKNQDTGWFSFTCTQTEVGGMTVAPAEDAEPTCTEAVICYFCQAIVKEATGHKLGDWVQIEAPTCSAMGTEESKCSVCQHTETRSVDKLPHTYDDKFDADCNVCGDVRVPVSVVAEGKCGVNTVWILTSDGILTISGNGDTEDYLVNITKDQPYRVYASQITKVVIEDGVTSIGRGAFYGFDNITEVVLPESLIAIHEYAFFGCTAIKTMNIPENTFYIGMYAFRKSGLASISFANAEGWTFANGVALDTANVKAFTTEMTYKQTCMRPVSDNGIVIANGVFGNKDQFTWTLTSTGVLTVSGNGNMPKFNVNTTPWYGYRGAIRSVVIEEGITSVGRCSFHTCRAITDITLPNSLETISEYAFYNCQFLTEATIPANVTRIEIYAFRKCFQLKDVTFMVNYGWSAGDEKVSATELNSNAADMLTLVNYTKIWTRDINAEEEILDPNYVTGGACNTTVKWALTYTDESKTSMKLTVSGTGAMPIFQTAGTPWYGYLDNIVEVEVCEGITEIGRCAFYGLKFVKTATIADTVNAINDYAFSGCFSLKSIEIPKSVTYIAETAFTKTGVTI